MTAHRRSDVNGRSMNARFLLNHINSVGSADGES
jgi:hypothetical protein